MAPKLALGPTALLVLECVRVYSSHAPARCTLDTHLDEELRHFEGSQQDAQFIRQVVYGMYRYKKFLDCFLNAFYHHRSGVASRQDAPTYRVMSYLALFRLQELGWEQFRVTLQEQDPQCMLVLFSYLFDHQQLQQAVREDLLKVYDKQFVDDTLSALLSWGDAMEQLLSGLRDKVYISSSGSQEVANTSSGEPGATSDFATTSTTTSSSSSRSSSSKRASRRSQVTQPRPFNLSQSAARPLPREAPLTPPPPRKPPPPRRSSSSPTRDQQELEQRRTVERAARLAAAQQAKAPELRVLTQVRSRLPQLQQEAEEALAAELRPQHPPPQPPPPPPTTQVRMTAAAVLREDALYSYKQAQEAAQLQQYEAGLRDDSEFTRWQEQERAAEAERQAARIAALKEAMSASSGAALAARHSLAAARLAAGKALKQQQQERQSQLQQLLDCERQQKSQLCEQVAADRQQATAAKAAVEAAAREKALQLREEQEAAAAAAAARRAAELAAKRDTVMQLRAQEAAPKKPLRVCDRTAVPDLAMNDQMSHHELQERLKLVKQHQEQEVEERRAQAHANRINRAAVLAQKAQRLMQIRQLAASQAATRRANSKAQQEATQQAITAKADVEAVTLLDKLTAKHEAAAAEQARTAAENKRVLFEQMQRAAGAAVVEEQKFRSLREGAERAAMQRQDHAVADAAVQDHLASRDTHVRQHARKEECAATRQFRTEYVARVIAAAAMTQEQARQELTSKRELVSTVRAAEADTIRKTAQRRQRKSTHMSLQERLAALTTGTLQDFD